MHVKGEAICHKGMAGDARRIPADVRILGLLDVVGGAMVVVIGVAWSLSILPLPPSWIGQEAMVLFGTVRVSSPLGFGLARSLRGVITVITGYGFLRGRAWGWWLSLLYMVEAIPSNIVIAPDYPRWAIFAFTCMALNTAWLTYRFRFFAPLGGIFRTSK